ncbi:MULTISPECIES: APC family permease [unclassified Streptomyces]|uniref:APC family permease n=1 Tax=unclassified Streptomyces TaxID=2593676 RepID=UPI001BE6A000|nr:MULTISPECIES: APC family permease [unclassified Streptomyces]MBT2406356.1 APC family permease [Streptomyces sp. ISL-21]MBT2458416.1 APC family permease [Streptomyces sp. ISL-86]MBT2607548.1 APC family permease [Streptomyces sp. ISL-87]
MTDALDALDSPPARTTKGIGVPALVVFYVSSIVGTGILLVPGLTKAQAGPAALLAWVALAVASYPFARFFAEISARSPDAAGLGSMVEAGFGPRHGRTASRLLLVTYAIGNPVMGVVSARSLLHLLGVPDASDTVLYGVAAAFMLLSTGFTLLGVTVGARIQAASLVVLLAGLGGAVLLAVPHMDAAAYTPFLSAGWGGVGTAVVIAFFSFLGWENVSTLAEQVEDPARSYRSAIRYAVPVVGLLYVTVTAAYLAVPGDDPLVITALLGASLGGAGAVAGDLLALGLAVIATNAWVLGASRLLGSAARDGVLPRSLTARPARPLVVLAAAYVCVLGLLAATGAGVELALITTSSCFLLLYIVAAAAALKAEAAAPALRATAVVTLLISAGFLAFAGTGLLIAVLLALGCHLAAHLNFLHRKAFAR